MNDVLLFIALLSLGGAFYWLFYSAIKWFEKI